MVIYRWKSFGEVMLQNVFVSQGRGGVRKQVMTECDESAQIIDSIQVD